MERVAEDVYFKGVSNILQYMNLMLKSFVKGFTTKISLAE